MKAGYRIESKNKKVQGTIKSIKDGEIWIEFDSPVKGKNEDGDILVQKEGYVTKEQFDQIFDLIEESDWSKIWDDNSN